MPPNQPKKSSDPAWPVTLATLAITVVALGLVAAQSDYAKDQTDNYSLHTMGMRLPILQSTTNLVQRDAYCIPLSAYGRSLAEHLAPDARIFIDGMIGKTNGGSLGLYYFLRNALFPRPVEISLDGHAIMTDEGAQGVPCDSPEILKEKGFDLLMTPGGNGGFRLIPLTPKGTPE